MDVLNSAIVLFNHWGVVFCDFAGRMLVQSGILVGLILMADLLLRARVCACFRYGLWLLVLVKLVLPPSLALPTGVAYWLGSYLPAVPAASAPAVPAVSAAAPAYVTPLLDAVAASAGAAEITSAGSGIASVQWPGVVLLVWAAGIVLLSALVLRRVMLVRRSLHRSRPAGPQIIALLEECRARLGVPARVTLRLTDDMHSPCVCGFARPVILLPTSLPPGLGLAGLRTILTHELAHIRRRDPWVSLVQTTLQVVYFWHPLVWMANAKLRHLRELAVDETVIVTLQSQARCYTDTLIDIAQMAFRKPAFSLRLMGIAESKRALERRITHMLNRRISKRPALGLSGLLAIVAIGAVLVPMGCESMTARTQRDVLQKAPALPVGIAELFELSKDGIFEKYGESKHIFYGDQTYTLQNLPETYYLPYEDVSFLVDDDTVAEITLLSPRHVLGNGIRVGDSEDKVKQAFGPGFVLEETEFKDYLVYEPVGVSFEINKQNRSVMEININREYGDPARMQAYARADELAAQLPEKIARFDIDSADLRQVLTTFGQPVKYVWGPKTLSPDQLPNRFIAVYPGDFHVFMLDNRVVELRHEHGSKYVYAGKLHVGSTLEEAIALLGPPMKTVEGKPIDWQDSANVLFKNIEGRKGHCYYHRPDRKVRVWFGNNKVAAIYMTRSDYGQERSEPFDPEFARLLPERVAKLGIDSAGPEQVKEIFGKPLKYLWGEQTFEPNALPANYIMSYPCSLHVWLQKGRIMEIRHERGSPYVYRDKVRIGSTLQEALDLLGQPDETVTGQKNTFKDKVLYRNIDGRSGHDYYHRADQKVRVWFSDDKVIAIYMTRSDFPTP